MEFVKTKRGARALLHEGYRYVINRTTVQMKEYFAQKAVPVLLPLTKQNGRRNQLSCMKELQLIHDVASKARSVCVYVKYNV